MLTPSFEFHVKRLERPTQDRTAHGVLGLTSEVGELAALLKREMTTGDPVDTIDILDECGDVLYYLAIVLDDAGFDLDTAMRCVIHKMDRRAASREKNKEAERALLLSILDGG